MIRAYKKKELKPFFITSGGLILGMVLAVLINIGNISLTGINNHENVHDVIIWKEDAEFLKGLLKHYITDLLYEMSVNLKIKAVQAENLSKNIN